MAIRAKALNAFLVFTAYLLSCAAFLSEANAATFPCAIGPSDIAGLTFTNPGGTNPSDPNDYALGGILTGENISATTGGCNSLPTTSIRPLVAGTPTATLNLPVVSATAQGGWLMRTAANEVRYMPPSASFSGTDSFTIDNNNNSRVITVTVNVLAASDTTPPAAPVIAAPINGAILSLSAPAFTGTAEAASTVRVYIDGSLAGTVTATGGNWSFTPGSALADGAHTVYATATDAANNTSPNSTTINFTIDTTPPPAPVVTTPANGSTTSDTTPTVSGTAEPASTVTVTIDGSAAGATTANGSGNWSFTPGSALADGAHNVRATAADSAGNTSPNSNTNSFTITQLPTASNSSATVAHGSSNNAIALSLSGGTATSVTVVAQATHGTATAAGTSISYTPTAGYAGADSFTFRASNAAGDSNVATVTITVSAPTITLSPTTLTNPTVGSPYSATITASGGQPTYSYAVTAGTLPSGLTLAANGTLSGTPSATGPFNFTITATDSSTGTGPFTGSRAYSFSIAAPTITMSPVAGALPGATAGSAYSQSISASGGTAPYGFNVSSGTLPPGMALNASTGALSGTPTSSGNYNFTVTATDSNSFTGSAAYSLSVALPTLSSSTTLPDGVAGQAYNQTLVASGGIAPYNYSLLSGLPTGLTLSTSGIITGTPTQTGSFNLTVRVFDSTGGTGPAQADLVFPLTIHAPTLSIAPASLPDGLIGTAYSQSLTGSGGTTPYTFTIDSGTLPGGLTLSTTGVLSGTPTTQGSFAFAIRMTDSTTGGTHSTTRNYTITVGTPMTVTPATLPSGQVGAAYNQTIGAIDGAPPYSFAVTAGTLPAGLTLTTGGVLSGTPTAGGSFNVTITATDSGGATASRAYTLSIGGAALALAPTTLPAMSYNTPISVALTASGGTAPYSYAISGGTFPTGLTLSATGTLSGTPSAPGSYNFTVTATDSSSGVGAPFTVSQAYSVTISVPTITIAPTTLPDATIGIAYSQSLSASGGTAPYSFSVSAGALPPGMLLSAGGMFTGTPSAGGSFTFTITAADSSPAGPYSASQVYTLTIGAPSITLAPTTLPAATMEAPYTAALSATGGIAPYSYAVTTGALPAGLTLSATGALSGTPSGHGSFAFTVTATDSSGGTGPYTGTQSYNLTVSPPLAPFAGDVNASIAYGSSANPIALSLSGGTATSVAVAAPPVHGTAVVAGLAIHYTPAPGYAGPDSFTYTASNDGGTSAPATATITVGDATIAVGPASLANGQQDVPYSATLSASGGTAPYSYGISAGALPAGLSLSSTGVLSGTPAESGSFAFTVTATDGSTGAGPFSGATAYTLQIALPAPPVARDAPVTSVQGSTVQNTQSVDIDLSTLVTGNYTEVRIDTQPQHGSVTLATGGHYVATYRPAAGYQGADAFTFVAVGPGGSSAPAQVAIDVVGAVPVAPSLSVTLLNGGEVTVDVTTGATEGPFTNAAVVSVTPTDALSTELIAGGTADSRSYGLKLKALGRFSGTATVRYTLSNVFGASQPATVTVMVEARPDPSEDRVVRALSAAQAEATRRFASTQLDNFARRNEQLHGGGGASRGKQIGFRLSGGDAMPQQPPEHANELDMRALRGVELADASPGASPVIGELAAAESAAAPSGERRIGSLELWSGGALLIGTRDATSGRSKLRVSSSGLSAGLDLKLSDALTLGIGGGYGFDRTKVGQDGEGRLDGENWVGALYGSLTPMAGLFVDGVIGVGGLDFETRRLVEANGLTARGRRDGSMLFGSFATGFERFSDRWRFSGYGRFEYMAARLDAYAETGADIYNLSFARREPESFASILGARGSIALPASIGLFTPRGRIEWRHEFNRSGAQALDYADIVGANGLGYGYLIDDDHWARDEIQLEIGTGLEVENGWTLGVDLGGRFGSGTAIGTAKISGSKKF